MKTSFSLCLKGHIYLSLFVLFSGCSAQINFHSFGLGGNKVTKGGVTSFQPAVESSSMDMDNIYNINFINNLIIQDLCGGDSSSCDPDLAQVIALLESYNLEVPESILNGEFQLPASGSAMVSALSANTSPLRPVADYCSVPSFSGVNVLVNDGQGGGTPMTLTQYMDQYRTMDNGARLKMCEILNLRDEIKKEVKLNTAARFGYIMTEEQSSETLRLRARREFLYVFVNSILAFGTDFIGLLQYVGANVDASAAGAFASSVTKVNEGINKNKYQIRQIEEQNPNNKNATIETKQFFNENKGNTYLFVEQFISRGIVKNIDPVIVEYSIDAINFCKFVSGNANGTTINVSDYDECVSQATDYFSKVKFNHRASGEKYVKVEYTDAPYIVTPVPVLNLKYTVDHKSVVEIVLNDIQKTTVAIMRNELDNHPATAAELSFTTERMNTLNALTMTGTFGFGGAITDLTMERPIEESDLPAKLYASIFKDIHVLIPGSVSESDMNSLLDMSNSDMNFDRDEEGDVSFRLGASTDTLRLEHKRGQNLYQDFLGLNFRNLNFHFPPYDITSADIFVFDASLDEMNGDLRLVKPTGLSDLEIKRNGTLRNFAKLSNLDLRFATTSGAPQSGNSTREFKIQSMDAIPWNVQVQGDVDSLSSSLKTVIASQSGGLLAENDKFNILLTAPQGTRLEGYSNGPLVFASRIPAGQVEPLYYTLGLDLAGHVENIGPIDLVAAPEVNHQVDLVDEYITNVVMPDIMSRYSSEMSSRSALAQARNSALLTGNLDCGANGTKSISVSINRTPATSSNYIEVKSTDRYTITFDSASWSQQVSSQPYGPQVANSVGMNYSVYNSAMYVYESHSLHGSYQTDADNVIQNLNVTSYTVDSSLSCSGILTRN